MRKGGISDVLDIYATFAKEGGRVGSGSLGSGQGGVARCA
ncbi:sulfate adenylyltransferase [Streptomyces sp. WM4235]|nr:sulfate adenylyltransferase [Streptomyces sp. WM4235]